MNDAADIIAMTRDIVFLLLFLVVSMAVFFLYRKVSSILDSARRTIKNTEELVSTVSSKVVRPAAVGSGAAFGVGKLLAFLMGFSKRKERGGKNDG